jgi:hypothetical protein
MDFFDYIMSQAQGQTPGARDAPIPFGIDQADNQIRQLLDQWFETGDLSPYLPDFTPNLFPRGPVYTPGEYPGRIPV